MSGAASVRSLLEAARGLDRDALVPALVRSTGLSREGVELALARHLELDATDEEIASLVRAARGGGQASRIVVILASNVFVAALRALALARAASDDVIVRPSRRDPIFARALIEAARDGALRLGEGFDPAELREGEIHVYGRDETIAEVRRVAKVPVRGHGSGMGVALVSSPAQAPALAEDVVAFDQRGCLSPRIAIVLPRRGSRSAFGDADAFADALHASLGDALPRGEVPAEGRAEIRRYADTMTYAGRALVGREHVIGVGRSIVVPPVYRTVHVVPASSAEQARALVAPVDRAIVAVGADEPDLARAVAPPWARVSRVGHMQRPPLDGPVDRRRSDA